MHPVPSKQTLVQAFSELNLNVALAKVVNYYRTQNYPGTPDMQLLQYGGKQLLQAIRESVLDGHYEFQPIRPYFTVKNSGGLRMESMSSAMDRVAIQTLFNRPGYAIQKALTRSATVDGRLLSPACRFRPHWSPYMYSFWPSDYRRHRANALFLARRMRDGVVVHADIQNCYPSMNRTRLRSLLEPWFNAETWPWIDRYLDFTLAHDGTTGALWSGLPIEEPVARLMGNLYLHALDEFLLHELKIPCSRYVDDLFLVFPNGTAAREAMRRIEERLAVDLGMYLNSGKLEIETAASFVKGDAAAFSRRISRLNREIGMLSVSPSGRCGVEHELDRLIKDLPGINGADDPSSRLRVRGARFAAWRLAKLHVSECEQKLGLLLRDPRTQGIAGIALANLGTPEALSELAKWIPEQAGRLSDHERIVFAGTLLRSGRDELLLLLSRLGTEPPMLEAIFVQRTNQLNKLLKATRHPDPLVRRAAAVRILHGWTKPAKVRTDLIAVVRKEQDRDTRAIFLLALSHFSGNREARRLLDETGAEPGSLIGALARQLKMKPIATMLNETPTKLEEPSCHP